VVNSELIGGIDTYVLYGEESAFGTGVSTTKGFGGLIQNGKFDIDRQINEHAGFAGTGTSDGRITAKYTPGTVSTKGNIDFIAQDFDWLEFVLNGTKTGSGTVASPYVYSIGKTLNPLTISENMNNVTNDSERTFSGMLINSCSIRASTNETVNVGLEFIGGKIAKDIIISSNVAQSTNEVYNFSGGSIEMPDGTSLGNVIDSVDISINNNASVLYGLGSEEATNGRLGRLNINIKFSLKYLDDDQMDRLLGSSTGIADQTPVTLSIKFSKDTDKYVDFVFTDVVISRVGDNHDLNEFVVEDVDLLAKSLQVSEVQTS